MLYKHVSHSKLSAQEKERSRLPNEVRDSKNSV